MFVLWKNTNIAKCSLRLVMANSRRLRPCLWICIIIFLTAINSCQVSAGEVTEYEILENIFQIDKAKRLLTRPPGINGSYHEPVNVRLYAFLSRIYGIDEKNMEMKLHLFLRMVWTDPRLNEKHNSFKWFISDSNLKYVRLPERYKLWLPDLVITNEKGNDGSAVTNSYTTTLIRPNGTVEHLLSMPSLVVYCPMDLKKYPFDQQLCPLRVVTRTTNYKEVLLRWKESSPLAISINIGLPSYTLVDTRTVISDYRTNTGEYSSVTIQLVFDRDVHPYIWQFFVPVLVVVLISWIPFSLYGASMLRILIASSTTLFIGWYYMTSSLQLYVPYLTRLDIWRMVNFLFVLLAAMESFYVVHFLKYSTSKKYFDSPKLEREEVDVEVAKVKSNFMIVFVGVPKGTENLDEKCRLYFPIMYCVFIFLYWFSC